MQARSTLATRRPDLPAGWSTVTLPLERSTLVHHIGLTTELGYRAAAALYAANGDLSTASAA